MMINNLLIFYFTFSAKNTKNNRECEDDEVIEFDIEIEDEDSEELISVEDAQLNELYVL
jgi:hypothetical protein